MYGQHKTSHPFVGSGGDKRPASKIKAPKSLHIVGGRAFWGRLSQRRNKYKKYPKTLRLPSPFSNEIMTMTQNDRPTLKTAEQVKDIVQ
eukprot:scaffold7656_cov76-Skeletonema_marinoi.AAC.2